jgi:hypothetical protein
MTSTEFVDCRNLVGGTRIDVETKSRHYLIECLGGNVFRISGHPAICPEPVAADFEAGVISRGEHLRFRLSDRRPVKTTRVVRLCVDRPPAPRVSSSIH